jgi:hypothetical protein
MLNYYFFIISLFVVSSSLTAQNTVGLLSYDPQESYDGYNLIFPHNQQNVYLLNNCGEIVHTWSDTVYKPGNTAFIQKNGDLVRAGGRGVQSNPQFHAGGGGEMVERRNWEGDLLWRYYYNDSINRMHHDFTVLPNGNILILAWERKTKDEAVAAGRDTNNLVENELWPEHIIEVKPVGSSDVEIVWRWNVWDHLIQDFDSTKANFGVVADHPELININYDNNSGKADWLHANSIDYSPEMDQILLSIPFFNEIWIIDHSTTTEEAATHSGGTCDVGGDLMYRWGNPAAYNKGDSSDQKLFFQHDAHWMDLGLPNTSPDYGRIAIFNNKVDGSYSSVNILNPLFDNYSCEYSFVNTFLPTNFIWSYVHPDTNKMFTTGLGGVQRLPNGNTLISCGRQGYVFEANQDGDVVWEYEIPLQGGNQVSQGTEVPFGQNLIFRTYRYPKDFEGFDGRDLTPSGYLELNPDTAFCPNILNVSEYEKESVLQVYPNPVNQSFTIEIPTNSKTENMIEIFSSEGKLVHKEESNSFSVKINSSQWSAGVYLIKINGYSVVKITK